MKSIFITAGLAFASLGSAYAQQPAALRGTILDAQTQQPLPGVSVGVPGTSVGTTTDAAGHFATPAVVGAKRLVMPNFRPF